MFVIALSLSYIWVDNIGYHFKKGTNNKIIIWRILRRRPIIWKWYIPFCAILRITETDEVQGCGFVFGLGVSAAE